MRIKILSKEREKGALIKLIGLKFYVGKINENTKLLPKHIVQEVISGFQNSFGFNKFIIDQDGSVKCTGLLINPTEDEVKYSFKNYISLFEKIFEIYID